MLLLLIVITVGSLRLNSQVVLLVQDYKITKHIPLLLVYLLMHLYRQKLTLQSLRLLICLTCRFVRLGVFVVYMLMVARHLVSNQWFVLSILVFLYRKTIEQSFVTIDLLTLGTKHHSLMPSQQFHITQKVMHIGKMIGETSISVHLTTHLFSALVFSLLVLLTTS